MLLSLDDAAANVDVDVVGLNVADVAIARRVPARGAAVAAMPTSVERLAGSIEERIVTCVFFRIEKKGEKQRIR